MQAPDEIRTVYGRFDRFPMETLTKARLHTERRVRQRTVQEMEDDRRRHGTSGSCFDLALWLLDAFVGAHIDAFLIGTAVGAPNLHVAVCAIGWDGERYLCTARGMLPTSGICVDGTGEDRTIRTAGMAEVRRNRRSHFARCR